MNDFLGVGLGPSFPNDQSNAGLVAFPAEEYESPVFDLVRPPTGDIEFIPAKPGHFPVGISSFWAITSVQGTQTVPAAVQSGSDLARTNFTSSSQLSNTDVNTANVPCLGSQATVAGLTVQRFTNTPVFLNITNGASGTGGFALRAKLIAFVMWFPHGDT